MSADTGLFCYGTLQHPDVMEALIGARPRARTAHLEGFARSALRGEVYPGIVPASGARTPGILYTQLAPQDLEILDVFEGALYERVAVEAALDDGSRAPAWVYVLHPGQRERITGSAWSFERFCAEHAAAYVERGRALRQRHLAHRSGRS